MGKHFRVTVPPTMDYGSYTTIVHIGNYETRHKVALHDYNSCRAHDGLPPLKRMPNGTTYEQFNQNNKE